MSEGNGLTLLFCLYAYELFSFQQLFLISFQKEWVKLKLKGCIFMPGTGILMLSS